MRILVYCPTKDLFWRTIEDIFNLEHEGPLEYLFTRDNPYGEEEPRRNVFHAYEKAWVECLRGGYDALLTVESDMVVPPDALTKLLAVDAPVAYGLYCTRRGSHDWMTYINTANNGFPWKQLSRRPKMRREWWGQVHECVGAGFGCTLIQREAVERTVFDVDAQGWPDFQLSRQCNNQDIAQVCDLSVVCGHIKREPRAVVWPRAEVGRHFWLEEL